MHWIADYRVHGSVDDPDAGVVRYRCSAPARLRLDDRSVLVEVVDADVADLLADLSRWAAAAASFAAAGTLAVPLEVGPGERPGTAWVSRIADPTGASATLPAVAAAAAGVAALHAQGCVHGGLDAHRVLPTAHGGVVDLPRISGRPGPLLRAGRAADLDTVAPEVLRGERPGPAADVWALGALAVATAGGGLAHPDLATDDLLSAIDRVGRELPDATHVDGAASEVVAGCLRRDPDLRPSAAEVAAALAGVVQR